MRESDHASSPYVPPCFAAAACAPPMPSHSAETLAARARLWLRGHEPERLAASPSLQAASGGGGSRFRGLHPPFASRCSARFPLLPSERRRGNDTEKPRQEHNKVRAPQADNPSIVPWGRFIAGKTEHGDAKMRFTP